jgi:hypothetical protein
MLVRCLDDAIILSTWSWDTFNVPERIALALAMRGARVCSTAKFLPPRFRRKGRALHQIANGLYGLLTPVKSGAILAGVGRGQ